MHGTYTFSVDAPTPKRCDACDGELSLDARLASAFSIPAESGGIAQCGCCSMDLGPMNASYPRSSLTDHPHLRHDSELERRRVGLPPILCTQQRASPAFSTIRESTHHHLLPMPTFVKLQRSRLHRRVIALLGLASALAASPLAAQENRRRRDCARSGRDPSWSSGTTRDHRVAARRGTRGTHCARR